MSTLISINRVYYLIGFVVMLLVIMTLRDRGNPKRFTTALFWFLFGGIFLFGDLMVQELGKSLAYRIIGGCVPATIWWCCSVARRSARCDLRCGGCVMPGLTEPG